MPPVGHQLQAVDVLRPVPACGAAEHALPQTCPEFQMGKIAFRWNGTGPNGFRLALLCINLGAVENLCEQPTLVLKLVVHTQTLRVHTNSQADRTQLCR